MLLHFRQGIVEAQIPVFFRVTYPSVDLIVTDTNTTVAFAAGSKDYLYTEQQSVANAWGPLHLGIDQWLYWDLDNRTGYRTFGITIVEPIVASSMPSSPVMDQHWFDTTACEMKVWTGNVWSKKIRTFACKLAQGRVPVSMSANSPSFIGTQVGNTSDTYAGHIIYDATTNNAIKNANGQFVTTEDKLSTKTISLSQVKVASIIVEGEAQQNMAAHTIVVFSEFGKIVHADQFVAEQPIQFGIIESTAVVGQTVNVVTSGMVTSQAFDFSAIGVNALLYCNATGQLVSTPVVPNQTPVAVVVDRKTIQLGVALASSTDTIPVINLATDTVYGISRLSVPAEDSEDPIVVGDNDPRFDSYVRKTGDTMTGPLYLYGGPTQDLHAATKKYVDDSRTPAAGNQYEVQYNIGGQFAASNALRLAMPDESYNGMSLNVGSSDHISATITTSTWAGNLQIEGGGRQDSQPGSAVLQGGALYTTTSPAGGPGTIFGGHAMVTGGPASGEFGRAGDAWMQGGTGDWINGQSLIFGGTNYNTELGRSTANGGNVQIAGGAAQGSTSTYQGGTVVIRGGRADGSGASGNVEIHGGIGNEGATGIPGCINMLTNDTFRLTIGETGDWQVGINRDTGTTGMVLTSQGAGHSPIWAAAPTGGGGSGATALSGLTDVTLATPSVNQVLTFNGTKWVNATPTSSGGSGATALSGLTDVTLATPSVNQVLTFNGTKWVNATPTSSGGGGGSGIDPLQLSVTATASEFKSPTANANQWIVQYNIAGSPGNGNYGAAATVDANGNTYVASGTTSGITGYPVVHLTKFDTTGGVVWTYDFDVNWASSPTFDQYMMFVTAVQPYGGDSIDVLVGSNSGARMSGLVRFNYNTLSASAYLYTNTDVPVSMSSNWIVSSRVDSWPFVASLIDMNGGNYNSSAKLYNANSATTITPQQVIKEASTGYLYIAYTLSDFLTTGVMKVDPSTYSILWAKTIAGTKTVMTQTIAGNIVCVSGHSHPVYGNDDLAIWCLGAAGATLWTHTASFSLTRTDVPRPLSVATDYSNNTYVLCTANFGTQDRWVISSFDMYGNIRWVKSFTMNAAGSTAPSSSGYSTDYAAHSLFFTGNSLVVVGNGGAWITVANIDLNGNIASCPGVCTVDDIVSTSIFEASLYTVSNDTSLTLLQDGTVNAPTLAIGSTVNNTINPGPTRWLCVPHKLTVDGDVVVRGNIAVHGTVGKAGQMLMSNGELTYWGAPSVPVIVDNALWNFGLVPSDQPNPFTAGGNNVGNTIAIGGNAFAGSTNGYDNIAIGTDTLNYLHSSNPSYNIAVGWRAGRDFDGGSNNIAIGTQAMSSYNGSDTASRDNNIAIGWRAQWKTRGGYNLIAIGDESMNANTTGTYAIAIGSQAMYNASNVGYGNIAIGVASMSYMTNLGQENVVIGDAAMSGGSASPWGCTAIGYAAMSGAGGTSSTGLGSYALSWSTYNNCTGVGANTSVTGANQVQLGDSSTTTYAYGAVQNRSDARDKADVRDTVLGLSFVNKLRPVDYRWDYRSDYVFTFTDNYGESIDTNSNIRPIIDDFGDQQLIKNAVHDGSRKRSRYHSGLIAQEVKHTMDELQVEFGGFQDHSIAGGDDVLSIGYVELIGPLIKSVQELTAKLEEANTRIAQLEAKLA